MKKKPMRHKNPPTYPMDQAYWYLCPETLQRLTHNVEVDLVIVGGGMAGLSAAQAALKRGLSVAIIEKTFVGSGASGKSSGFITPDAEFSFSDLVRMHGAQDAQRIWQFIQSGVDTIHSNIMHYSFECGYEPKDTLTLASSKHSVKKIIHEHETRLKYHLESNFYAQQETSNILQSSGYYAGVSYGKTFSMKAFDYCQNMKKILQQQGVRIFEESPVIKIASHAIATAEAQITAAHIIIATDYALPELAPFTYDIYHAQTFLLASAPLPETLARELFPQRPMMAWDTDLIYHYFRLTHDHRLLIGGADIFSTYSKQPSFHNRRVFRQLSHYAQHYFPQLPLQWEYMWPGLIGITKDLFPLAGKDKDNPHIYYISGAAGLPWAAALGAYAIDSLYENRDDLNKFFNPYRQFFIPHALQAITGTRLAFALSNFKQVGSL